MKAVVVEIKDGYAALLSDQGSIIKVKNNAYKIGQVIDMKRQSSFKARKLITWASAAAAFVMLCGVGAWAYASPYSYVSLDVNPSIEYSLNRFDLVIDVKAVNDDGQEILSQIHIDSLKNKKIEEAISRTVNQIAEQGYFDGELEGGIVIATYGENPEKAEELAEKLQVEVEKETVRNEEDQEQDQDQDQEQDQDQDQEKDQVQVEAVSVGLARVQKARELGVTPGKLNLVEKLQKSAEDPTSIDIQEWLKKPVKEIMKATKENKKAAKAKEKASEQIVAEPKTDTGQENTDTNIDSKDTKDINTKKVPKGQLDKIEKKEAKEIIKADKEAAKEKAKAEKEAVKAEKKTDKANAKNVKPNGNNKAKSR